MNNRLATLLNSLGMQPRSIHSVSGGDINDSYHITCQSGKGYFVKINRPGEPKDIIKTEAQGLEMMKKAGVHILPDTIRWAENKNDACLILPFYKTKKASVKEWEHFFRQLASMHQISNEVFGGPDNYIGFLPQENSNFNNWIPFYRENRLLPQLRLAYQKGYIKSQYEKKWSHLFDNLPEIMPVERPALIHGDLWGGNIISTESGVILIDPCPHYGHREMDLGMMMLFSGIPLQQYINSYEEVYPLEKGLWDRIEIYQLYYLLVHLNMFGTAYLPGVQRILKKFSG